MINNITLNLYDYLLDDCPHKFCIYNENGRCVSEDEELYEDVRKVIRFNLNPKSGVLKNTYILCQSTHVAEGYCDTCGNKLIEVKEMLPYGDTFVPHTYIECQNC